MYIAYCVPDAIQGLGKSQKVTIVFFLSWLVADVCSSCCCLCLRRSTGYCDYFECSDYRRCPIVVSKGTAWTTTCFESLTWLPPTSSLNHQTSFEQFTLLLKSKKKKMTKQKKTFLMH
jgi:hypothetical protein